MYDHRKEVSTGAVELAADGLNSSPNFKKSSSLPINLKTTDYLKSYSKTPNNMAVKHSIWRFLWETGKLIRYSLLPTRFSVQIYSKVSRMASGFEAPSSEPSVSLSGVGVSRSRTVSWLRYFANNLKPSKISSQYHTASGKVGKQHTIQPRRRENVKWMVHNLLLRGIRCSLLVVNWKRNGTNFSSTGTLIKISFCLPCAAPRNRSFRFRRRCPGFFFALRYYLFANFLLPQTGTQTHTQTDTLTH